MTATDPTITYYPVNQDPSKIVTFDCLLRDAQYVVSILPPEESGRLAIIVACGQANDPEAIIPVALRQQEIIRIAQTVRLRGEGEAAELAQRLTAGLLPLLPEYPYLADGFAAIKAQNKSTYDIQGAIGAQLIAETLDALNR